MSIDTLAAFLGWSTVINFCLLAASTAALLTARRAITKIHSNMFGLDESKLSEAYFRYLAQYKVVTLSLNLAPYIALKILASSV